MILNSLRKYWHPIAALLALPVLFSGATAAAPVAQAFRFERADYNPAILSLSFNLERGVAAAPATEAADAFLDLILITRQGEPIGRRVALSRQRFATQLRTLYDQLAKQDSLEVTSPAAATRQLYEALIGPLAEELRRQKVTTLLIAADRGLQAVPFAALHDGQQFLGERYAFAITPSLTFTSFSPPRSAASRLLAAGASEFNGLSPLPLVPQELDRLSTIGVADQHLNQAFTPQVLLSQAADPRYDRVHVASHAEFLPGGPSKSVLHTGTGSMPLTDFLRLRQRRDGEPLELFSLSACRTALGDSATELGFAGLALQAGSRSAIGTLWYVDDVATSAYFLQLYRFLDQGMPKAEALQATRVAMIQRRLRLQGDQVLAADGTPLLVNLTAAQQRRVASGLNHPFFWGGIELIGSPW
jgi:CHAT domain-containing protein